MFRVRNYNLVFLFVASLFATSPAYSYDLAYNVGKIPGAKIIKGSCDPNLPNSDSNSCASKGIARNNFTVKISFDPKQYYAQAPQTITIPGPPVRPTKFVVNPTTNAVSFGLGTCGSVPDCYSISQYVYKVDGTQITIDPNTTQFNTPTINGAAITLLNTNTSIYTAPTQLKIATSGAVKTAVLDNDGKEIKTKKIYIGSSNSLNDNGDAVDPLSSNCTGANAGKCVDGYDAEVVAVQKVIYAAKCSKTVDPNANSGNPTYVKVASTTALSSPVTNGGITTSVEACPNGAVVRNLVAVDSFAANSRTCTIGSGQTYQSGQPVMTIDCEVAKDLNQCATTDPAQCNKAMVGGGDMYKPDGTKLISPGKVIPSVPGPDVTRTINGSLFNLVFPIVSLDEINGFNAQEINVGHTSSIYLKTRFEMRYEGSKACVYAYGPDPSKEWRVGSNYPLNLNDVYDLPSNTANPIDPALQPTERRPDAVNGVDNCVPAPIPTAGNSMPTWNNMVSKVCTNYETSSSQFRWANGTNRAFLGIVVECVEQTLLAIFYPTSAYEGVAQQTFFSNMQSKLLNAIRGLLALYIIFFGYKLITGKSVPKREEWMWIFIKMALVVYFAMGNGMTAWLPSMLNISKNLSIVVMNAGLGASQQDAELSCKNAVDVNACKAQIQQDASMSYPYCDFRDKTKFPYAPGKEYMQLWDIIDCKLSKYIGIGDNYDYPGAPQILFVGVVSIISLGLGIPIFIFSMMFLATTIMIAVRVVNIYIMAFMGVIILVFISPIVIPAVLFEQTKNYFTQWLGQIIAFLLQPVILFGFLSFMFIMIDMVMFGNNHYFEPAGQSTPAMRLINSQSARDGGIIHGELSGHNLPSNGSPGIPGSIESRPVWTQANIDCGGADTKCKDKGAAGYQLQAASFRQTKWPSDGFPLINIWTVSMEDGGTLLMIALGKLLLISIISYILISSVENLSARMVGTMQSGAQGFAAAPVMSPRAMVAGGVQALGAANSLSNRLSPLRKSNRDAAYKRAGAVGGPAKNLTVGTAKGIWNSGKYMASGQAKSDLSKAAQDAKKSIFGPSAKDKAEAEKSRSEAINKKAMDAHSAMVGRDAAGNKIMNNISQDVKKAEDYNTQQRAQTSIKQKAVFDELKSPQGMKPAQRSAQTQQRADLMKDISALGSGGSISPSGVKDAIAKQDLSEAKARASGPGLQALNEQIKQRGQGSDGSGGSGGTGA